MVPECLHECNNLQGLIVSIHYGRDYMWYSYEYSLKYIWMWWSRKTVIVWLNLYLTSIQVISELDWSCELQPIYVDYSSCNKFILLKCDMFGSKFLMAFILFRKLTGRSKSIAMLTWWEQQFSFWQIQIQIDGLGVILYSAGIMYQWIWYWTVFNLIGKLY